MQIDRICVFSQGKMLVQEGERATIPTQETVQPILPPNADLLRVSANNGLACMALGLKGESPEAPHGTAWQEFRPLYDTMPANEFALATKAKEIVFWDEHSKFCPKCGVKMRYLTDFSRKCQICGYEMYPPISPAIIVRIRRGEDEILMVRAHNFRGDHYGLVAGFVEAGETFEECVVREVREEVGLEITNLQYFGNQAWPFPCGQMIGFTADYVSGEIKIQEEELADAAFFHRDSLPKLPHPMSIARRLVDSFLAEKK